MQLFYLSANLKQSNLTASSWLLDSGASNHFCHSLEAFTEYAPFPTPLTVHTGGSQSLKAYGLGTVQLRVPSKSDLFILRITQVHYVPALRRNLISLSAMLHSKWSMTTVSKKMKLSRGAQTFSASAENGIFVVDTLPVLQPQRIHQKKSIGLKNPEKHNNSKTRNQAPQYPTKSHESRFFDRERHDQVHSRNSNSRRRYQEEYFTGTPNDSRQSSYFTNFNRHDTSDSCDPRYRFPDYNNCYTFNRIRSYW